MEGASNGAAQSGNNQSPPGRPNGHVHLVRNELALFSEAAVLKLDGDVVLEFVA